VILGFRITNQRQSAPSIELGKAGANRIQRINKIPFTGLRSFGVLAQESVMEFAAM
jgi:hypothetical protein